jgi:type IV secretory pathway component VirB8
LLVKNKKEKNEEEKRKEMGPSYFEAASNWATWAIKKKEENRKLLWATFSLSRVGCVNEGFSLARDISLAQDK